MKNINKIFSEFANGVARLSGKPVAFVVAALVVLVWAVTALSSTTRIHGS
jgi:low affinity Fe/Cu permease